MSFRVKPVDPNAVIRDPHTMRILSVDGDNVPDNSFWRRRVLAGEVLILEDTPIVVVVEGATETDARRAAIQPVARAGLLDPSLASSTSHEGGERAAPLGSEPANGETKLVGNAPIKPLITR